MKKPVRSLVATLLAAFFSASLAAEVMSLRGDELLSKAKEPPRTSVMNVKGGIERSYEQQPPMIPHATDSYTIDLRNNGCLNCHSEETYEEKNAPKIGDSHYLNREGEKLSHVAGRRYFCNQCHVPQEGAEPLVKNNFSGTR